MRSIFLAGMLLLASVSTAPAEDPAARFAFLGQPEQIVRQQVGFEAAGLYAKKDFAALNALMKRYRDSGERTPSGTWKLSHVYISGFTLQMPYDAAFEKNWAHIFEIGQEWMAKSPSPATYIILANEYMNYGWQLSEKAKDGKTQFLAETAKARKLLEDNKAFAAVDPHWYATMARVAAAQQWPEKDIQPLYAEAVKANPHYYETYFAVMDALVPYWSDSALGAIAFAHDAAQAASDEPDLYIRILWDAMQNGYAPYALSVNTSEMHSSIEALVARYPDRWNINNVAHIACRSLDKPLTRAMIDKIGDGTSLGQTMAVMVDAWENDPGVFNKCQKWSHDLASAPF